jgi:kojibiose phosphorylase
MNFAAYHLTAAANPEDERGSISARALTGAIYRGHIFWDTEIFILPFLIFTWPRAARAVLMYRYHLLPQARENARQMGLRGANFPWESALSGREMTPKAMIMPNGMVVAIRSGELEEHITAAVAHGVCSYLDATGDTGFLVEAGAELVIETARFWASRAEKRPDGYHIFDVEGPDEYHEQGVDDNFYTNAIAVWNLERGLRMVELLKTSFPEKWRELSEKNGLAQEELDLMREVASTMYLDMQREDGIIEQFDGYFGLEDINVHDYEPRTAPINIILGTGKAVRTQLVKQADVVMALYLLEERFSQELIARNFEYYDIRTGHGSSLSPSIYGLVAARLGKMERAIRYFRRAAQIDLADNMGNAAGGVHLAALGGLWQQMVMGFAGVRAQPEGLSVLPHVPTEWQRIGFRLIWRGILFEFDIEAGAITVSLEGEGTAELGILGMKAQTLATGKKYSARLEEKGWTAFGEEKG